MRRVLIGLVVMVTACGQMQAQPASSPATSPAATANTPMLFAVLEAKGTANLDQWNTVAIAGLDGHTMASATFTPMPVPSIGACIGAIDPPSAHLAAGKVFYADGNGVVRSLAIDGAVTTVATFPMTSPQQMLSFAVSPDGGRILGAIFTMPKNAGPCDGSASTATYSFDAYAATSGTSSRLVYHQTWTGSHGVMALTGWDAVGPIGTYPTVWASQGGGPSSTLGLFVRIDASTMKPLSPFADQGSCVVWQSVQSGAFVCTLDPVMTGGGTAQQSVDSPVSVRRADGSEIWRFTVTSTNTASGPILAPDERHVMICCADVAGPGFAQWVAGQDGSKATMSNGFTATGWLDSQTMIGYSHPDPLQQPPFSLGYVRSADLGQYTSLGLYGEFIGTVRD
jgi:hypothetical protein